MLRATHEALRAKALDAALASIDNLVLTVEASQEGLQQAMLLNKRQLEGLKLQRDAVLERAANETNFGRSLFHLIESLAPADSQVPPQPAPLETANDEVQFVDEAPQSPKRAKSNDRLETRQPSAFLD